MGGANTPQQQVPSGTQIEGMIAPTGIQQKVDLLTPEQTVMMPMLKKKTEVEFPVLSKIEKKKEITLDTPKSTGPYDNSPTADYPDVRGNTQNSQNRDTSVSEYMKAKTYNKPSAKQPIIKEGKYLNSSVADWPDERE
jgi:hypothetical protein